MNVNRVLFVCLLTLVGAALAFGQERVSSPLGFSIQQPNKWRVLDKGLSEANLKTLDVSENALEKMLADANNSVVVMAFIKYDPAEKVGVIPTVKIIMRPNPIDDFSIFMPAFIRGAGSSTSPFPDYEFIGQPAEVNVSGMRAVLATSRYTLKTHDGQKLDVRTRIYEIPYEKQYFQVMFMDNPKDEDCSLEFDALVKSIKIGR